jgi:hypothetical protein
MRVDEIEVMGAQSMAENIAYSLWLGNNAHATKTAASGVESLDNERHLLLSRQADCENLTHSAQTPYQPRLTSVGMGLFYHGVQAWIWGSC